MRFTTLSILLACATCLLVDGCTTAQPVSAYTYPPDFHYISRQELHSVMDRLAHDVTSLDRALRGAQAVTPEQRQEVVSLLSDMSLAADSLQRSGQTTNHPMLDMHLGDFKADIEAARGAAVREPPNYFLAGSIAGACLHCHAVAR